MNAIDLPRIAGITCEQCGYRGLSLRSETLQKRDVLQELRCERCGREQQRRIQREVHHANH